MVVASIIFVTAGTVYVYIVRSNVKSNQSTAMNQLKNDLSQELINSIKWAKCVTVTSSPTPLVQIKDHDPDGNCSSSSPLITEYGLEPVDATYFRFKKTTPPTSTAYLTPSNIVVSLFEPHQLFIRTPNPQTTQTFTIRLGLRDNSTLLEDEIDITVSKRISNFEQLDPTPTP
jgi:hypothetical protein